MASFTMCKNGKCPSRHVCYRSTATPSEGQRYYEYDHGGQAHCAQFWPAQDSDKGIYVPEERKPHSTGGINTGIAKRLAKKQVAGLIVEKRKLARRKKAAG